jgi:hypothetical protein
MHNMRRVISLGIERGGKFQHFGGTKFDAETAGFTALDYDGYSPFRHVILF